jgi:hypothetical protein
MALTFKRAMTATPEQEAVYQAWLADREDLNQRIEAFEKTFGKPKKIDFAAILSGNPIPQASHPEITEDGNMTGAIEAAVNAPGYFPMDHKRMREYLFSLGFPEDRLGNYYYTAVHRLKERGRLAINEDKKIVKAEKP